VPVPLPRTEFQPEGSPSAAGERPAAPRHAVLIALLGLVISGDFANFYITLSVVANEYPVITVMVVLALTAAAVALAHGIGSLQARHPIRAGAGAAARTAFAALAGSWLLLGLAAAVVRWFAPPGDAAPDQFGADQFGGSGTDPVAHLVPQLTSLLLFALYVASGVLAAWIGYLTHDAEQVRTTRRRIAWTGFLDRRARARLARAQIDLQRRLDEHERLTAEHAAELAEREALAEECKAHARLLIAGFLGDPVATEGLTRTRPAPSRSTP
jgi:hypothetical protein